MIILDSEFLIWFFKISLGVRVGVGVGVGVFVGVGGELFNIPWLPCVGVGSGVLVGVGAVVAVGNAVGVGVPLTLVVGIGLIVPPLSVGVGVSDGGNVGKGEGNGVSDGKIGGELLGIGTVGVGDGSSDIVGVVEIGGGVKVGTIV